MMNRLNAINVNLTTLLSSINSLHTDLITAANAQKANLLEILGQLNETHQLTRGLSKMCNTASAALFDIGEATGDVAEHINDTLMQFDCIPVGSYETFVDFCANCGEELHKGDNYEVVDGTEVLCAKCAEIEAEAEIEDEAEIEVEIEDEPVEVAANV